MLAHNVAQGVAHNVAQNGTQNASQTASHAIHLPYYPTMSPHNTFSKLLRPDGDERFARCWLLVQQSHCHFMELDRKT